MKFRLIFFFVLIIFCSSFVFASFTVDEISSVLTGETVTITGTCDASSLILQASDGYYIVWIDEVNTVEGDFSSEFVPPNDGDYTISVSCEGVPLDVTVCVGDTCVTDDTPAETPAAETSTSSSSGGGGGGGSRCSESWTCTSWSFCNSNLEETRECTDQNSCGTNSIIPNVTQSCEACEESWICNSWTECTDGTQSRTCTDSHDCGSIELKPDLSRSCEEDEGLVSGSSESLSTDLGEGGSSSSSSSSTETTSSSSSTASTDGGTEYVYLESDSFSSKAIASTKSFMSNYWLYVLLGAVGLLVLISLIAIAIHYHRKHMPAENTDELENYVKKEMEGGMTKEMIEKNLEHSGWNKQEVDSVLSQINPRPAAGMGNFPGQGPQFG